MCLLLWCSRFGWSLTPSLLVPADLGESAWLEKKLIPKLLKIHVLAEEHVTACRTSPKFAEFPYSNCAYSLRLLSNLSYLPPALLFFVFLSLSLPL